MGIFGSSDFVAIVLYVLFGAIAIVVFAIIYLLWSMYREGQRDEAAGYRQLFDEHSDRVGQADTICSWGVGIRCDNAATRPKLQALRSLEASKQSLTRYGSTAEQATQPHTAINVLRHTRSLPNISELDEIHELYPKK
ncbi:hypothetical protein THRCLA_20596 [Thraustotheca clavata]|uniref:Uncharacterized protein n=1 Tax=Thraustotheca clavata TaxID=74557 RepID=A0A1W0A5I7_9STRA|nr:hypothetical protein THRCLA_20596 [Thraustotheca clavata]